MSKNKGTFNITLYKGNIVNPLKRIRLIIVDNANNRN